MTYTDAFVIFGIPAIAIAIAYAAVRANEWSLGRDRHSSSK